MKRFKAWLAAGIAATGVVILSACSEAPEPASEVGSTVFYQGARVIVGEGSVVENATFGVDAGRIVALGTTGQVDVPAGAELVDLSGMTVMPAIVDAHVHLSTERAALIEDLERRAWFGVGAASTWGSDTTDDPLQVADELIPGVPRFRTAGSGITRPEPGRREVHWINTVEEGREAVRTEAARGVDLIKIWVDDRDGQYEKLTPEMYGAIIEEAHAHNLKVAAHIFTLEDAKGLLRAGVDIFAHGVRDQDIDEEFLALVAERPEVVLIPNLPGRGEPTDMSWAAGAMAAETIAELQSPNPDPEDREFFAVQARNLLRLHEAGMPVALGTDGNNAWEPHVQMEDMVALGMSPEDVIAAATRNAAAVLDIDEMGTLQPGKSADFVVLEANPLEDITNTRRINAVYLRGEPVDRAGLLTRWN